jgi:hypothetical protein
VKAADLEQKPILDPGGHCLLQETTHSTVQCDLYRGNQYSAVENVCLTEFQLHLCHAGGVESTVYCHGLYRGITTVIMCESF